MFHTPSYSFLPLYYKDRLENIIGYIEAFANFGDMLGPLIGGFFYDIGGYLAPFMFGAFICLLMIPLILRFEPKAENSLEL